MRGRYVHSRGFIYADLKPSNVLVNEFGMLKLCDFGLAHPIPKDKADQVCGAVNHSSIGVKRCG